MLFGLDRWLLCSGVTAKMSTGIMLLFRISSAVVVPGAVSSQDDGCFFNHVVCLTSFWSLGMSQASITIVSHANLGQQFSFIFKRKR